MKRFMLLLLVVAATVAGGVPGAYADGGEAQEEVFLEEVYFEFHEVCIKKLLISLGADSRTIMESLKSLKSQKTDFAKAKKQGKTFSEWYLSTDGPKGLNELKNIKTIMWAYFQQGGLVPELSRRFFEGNESQALRLAAYQSLTAFECHKMVEATRTP